MSFQPVVSFLQFRPSAHCAPPEGYRTAFLRHQERGASSFEQVAIAIGGNYNLTADGAEPERVGTIRALAGGALALAFAAVSLS